MNVLIGIPSGRGEISMQTSSSLVGMCKYFAARKIPFDCTIVKSADPSYSRNLLAKTFLNGDFDTFVGIDDDVGIEMSVLDTMLATGTNFIGSFIPQRFIDLDAFEKAVRDGKSGRAARFSAAPYVSATLAPADLSDLSRHQILQVDLVGTGFFILRRSVLEKMIRDKIAPLISITTADTPVAIHGFFNNISSKDEYLGEDYSFCRRVAEAGFTVNAYLGPGISHTGSMTFHT